VKPKTVRVPPELEPLFSRMEELVSTYFGALARSPEAGTIDVGGERYLLVRAASLSVELFRAVGDAYGASRRDEADAFARSILFDVAHSVGKADARAFHARMGLVDPIAKLSAGPIQFAHTGWASVDILPESQPSPDEQFCLLYDHPFSFEADAWLERGTTQPGPVCIMNAGYSSGWCEESFGVPLTASEIACRAAGDAHCRFVMAPPGRIAERIASYARAHPEEAAAAARAHIPAFLARKRSEDEARERRLEAEREVDLLETLAKSIALAPDFATALHLTVERICERTGWEIGGAWHVSPDGETLERLPVFYTSAPELAFFARDDPRKPRKGEGSLGRSWASGEPRRATIADVARAPELFPAAPVARASGIVASFCIPVIAEGSLVLIFEFGSMRVRPEDDRLFELACVAAHQIGSILELKRVSEQNASFVYALTSLRDAVQITTPREASGGTRTLFANSAYAKLLGYASAEDAFGKSIAAHWGPATDLARVRRIGDQLALGKGVRDELVAYRLDGTEFQVGFSLSPVMDRSGRHVMTAAVLRDVQAEQREAEERTELETRAASANAAWRETFDLVDSPTALVAPDGRLVRINLAACAMLGVSPEEVEGRSIESFGDVEPWATVARQRLDVEASGVGAAVQVPDTPTRRTWDVSIRPFPSGGVLFLARDVTAMLELQESLQKSEAMAALGRMVAGVAHEVRNPLFGIGATLDAMDARFRDREDYAPFLRVLRGELGRLASLMTDLLDYGRPPRLVRTPSSLREIADQAVARCAAKAESVGVELRHVAVEPAQVGDLANLDRARLLQVLINLIENAVAVSPVGGVVTVSHARGDGSTIVHVEDEGPGIPAADLGLLFEPFFSNRKGGTGLGLSIVQRIVEQHDGRVVAENRDGGGARLTVVLPAGGDTAS
jgi:PAS domain S-box-containing protein